MAKLILAVGHETEDLPLQSSSLQNTKIAIVEINRTCTDSDRSTNRISWLSQIKFQQIDTRMKKS